MHKTALGAEDAVPWEYDENPIKMARLIKKAGISLVLIEQTDKSKSIYDIPVDFDICFNVTAAIVTNTKQA